ncbi:MAG: glycosyltransferase family 4 protein [Candidatus Sabulitectum sp.]|nr:glycosyltransferase family 4 protein [Candidatus Sabulitectum sp.]
MRIAIHIDCPPWNLTGIGRYMIELSKALVARGTEIDAWSRLGWYKASRDIFSGLGIPVLPILSWRKYNDILMPRAYVSLRKPRVLHNPNGSLLQREKGLLQTVMVHDLGVFMFNDIKPADEVNLWQNRIRKCVSEASGILVNSVTTANDLADIFPESREKTFLTMLGVDHLDYITVQNSRRADHILAVGTIEPRKNYSGLLEAYRIMNSHRKDIPPLVIAGGFGYRANEITEKARDLGVGEKVRFEGYVSENRLRQLYENACCLAHTALYEGFGFTVPEALGFGIPVVCSVSGALGELYRNVAYMVDPQDPESIAHGLLKAIDTGFTPEHRAKAAILFRDLSWNRCASQTEAAFKTISG